MNFNTQICTTIEQSERLLALGLKKETADMCLDEVVEGEWMPIAVHVIFSSQIPAWSLHRLIAMCPDFVIAEQRNHEKLYEEVISNIKFAIEEGLFGEFCPVTEGKTNLHYFKAENHVRAIRKYLRWYFRKHKEHHKYAFGPPFDETSYEWGKFKVVDMKGVVRYYK